MGRNPLSKTDKGECIKDLSENEKFNYSEIYRPPGIVKIKDSRDDYDHGSSKNVDLAYRSASKPN